MDVCARPHFIHLERLHSLIRVSGAFQLQPLPLTTQQIKQKNKKKKKTKPTQTENERNFKQELVCSILNELNWHSKLGENYGYTLLLQCNNIGEGSGRNINPWTTWILLLNKKQYNIVYFVKWTAKSDVITFVSHCSVRINISALFKAISVRFFFRAPERWTKRQERNTTPHAVHIQPHSEFQRNGFVRDNCQLNMNNIQLINNNNNKIRSRSDNNGNKGNSTLLHCALARNES